MKVFQARIILFALLNTLSVQAQTWTQATNAPIADWTGIACSADGSKLVASAYTFYYTNGPTPLGAIYTSTNSGLDWRSNSLPPAHWYSVACSADGNKLAAIGNGLFTSTNSGAAWQSNGIPNEPWNSVTCSANGRTLVLVGFSGTLAVSTNFGITWQYTTVNPYLNLQSVACSSDGNKLIAVDNEYGTIWIATNSNSEGIVWKLAFTNTWEDWKPAIASMDFKKLAVGTRGYAIFTSTNSGVSWNSNTVSGAYEWWSLASSADGTKLAGTTVMVSAQLQGHIFTSIDSGNTWTSNNVPATNWTAIVSSADGNKLVALATDRLITFTRGYGAIYLSQKTPAPSLNLIGSNPNLKLSWPVPSANFALQQNSNLDPNGWITITNGCALNSTNLENELILSATNGHGYFRLIAQ